LNEWQTDADEDQEKREFPEGKTADFNHKMTRFMKSAAFILTNMLYSATYNMIKTNILNLT
jgi:hypothetical protein